MAPKKSKLKKMFSPPPPPAADDSFAVDNDDLMDDLMAQLDSNDAAVRKESAVVITEMQAREEKVAAEAPRKHDPKERFKARQARKAAALAESYAPNDEEADARLRREAEDEEKQINAVCEELGLKGYPINPDGHCLFSAVADQLILLGILPASATYTTTRHAAANYIHSHPDDFLPFLPAVGGEDAAGATDAGLMSRAQFDEYCATMRDTGIWGGEPEILALSRAYGVPINVVQGGVPPIVVHSPDGHGEPSPVRDKRAAYISYHRRLYGLGEHYNSLRPKSLANTIKAAFQ